MLCRPLLLSFIFILKKSLFKLNQFNEIHCIETRRKISNRKCSERKMSQTMRKIFMRCRRRRSIFRRLSVACVIRSVRWADSYECWSFFTQSTRSFAETKKKHRRQLYEAYPNYDRMKKNKVWTEFFFWFSSSSSRREKQPKRRHKLKSRLVYFKHSRCAFVSSRRRAENTVSKKVYFSSKSDL